MFFRQHAKTKIGDELYLDKLLGHIIGAATIDLYSETFEHRFRFMDTALCMALYCASGKRSAQALHILETELGFTNLVHLKGGINSWEMEDYELVKN